MNLGERLKAERLRLGCSQTDFAAIAGASKHSQINWERGDATPNGAHLAAWAEAGVDVLYVVTGRWEGRASVPQLGPDEELLLDSYRGLSAKARKQLLASLLTGGKAGLNSKGDGVHVTGSKNRTAGRDYREE